MTTPTADQKEVEVLAGKVTLPGFLGIPEGAKGIVVFAHGSGSSRYSPRNQYVAKMMRDGGLATLLFDLLTPEEEEVDMVTRQIRFDIPFLGDRLNQATAWLLAQPEIKDLNIGYIGSSTGAGAALIGAARNRERVKAVVSRGGRPDLASQAIPNVNAPTLLIVGGNDFAVIGMNEEVLPLFTVEAKLEIVPGATHLFDEEGTLEKASELARDWFVKHLN